MKLIQQSGPHCLVTSAAMCLGVQPRHIHNFLGIDGTEVWFPPNKMRGIHIQEVQLYAMQMDKCFFPFERYPEIAPDEKATPRLINENTDELEDEFVRAIRGRVAILIMNGHACAWNGRIVYDPRGWVADYERYHFHEAWILGDLENQSP